MASNQFLALPSAARSRREGGLSGSAKTTARQPRHPGYSLFEWSKLSESSASINEGQHLHLNLGELEKHNTEDDCWTAIRGKVYNVTKFLKYHPGRKAQLMRGAGIDCTHLYDKVHSWVNEEAILKHCVIGELVTGGSGTRIHKCIVTGIENVTHDTKLFTLQKPLPTDLLVPIGHHIRIHAQIKGEYMEREYTPVAQFGEPAIDVVEDSLLLMIKIYPHGKMTQHLETIKVGDSLSVSGPAGYFPASKITSTKRMILIVAGAGFTPMIKLIHSRLNVNTDAKAEFLTLLLCANKTEEDILWKETLEELRHSSPLFEVVHILSSASESWKGEKGRISQSFLQQHLPPPPVQSQYDDIMICVCGPLLFARTVCNFLLILNYPDDVIYSFD